MAARPTRLELGSSAASVSAVQPTYRARSHSSDPLESNCSSAWPLGATDLRAGPTQNSRPWSRSFPFAPRRVFAMLSRSALRLSVPKSIPCRSRTPPSPSPSPSRFAHTRSPVSLAARPVLRVAASAALRSSVPRIPAHSARWTAQRSYAAEAGGKFARTLPHMNIGTIGSVSSRLAGGIEHS